MPKKILNGKVLRTSMEKTVVVEVARYFQHPRYGKRVKRTSRYAVHDSLGVAVDETVRIEECRPYSKNVHYQIVAQEKGKKS